MKFKSSIQPLCRACGKPIAKHTRSIYFGASPGSSGSMIESGQSRFDKPRSRAEAQRLVNEQITSHTWRRVSRNGERLPEEDYIDRINVWDGETYEDEFFCKQNCAADLGRAMARQDWYLRPYKDAVVKRGF